MGGNTSCITVETPDQHMVIIDAGSGIRRVGQALMRPSYSKVVGTLLISHTHWDHIQGFPYFAPAFERHNRIVVVGQKRVGQHLEEILARQIVEPYLPFDYKTLSADVHVKEVDDGETLIVGDETVIRVANLNHPGGSLGFRVESNGAVLTYCTDTTHPDDGVEPSVVALARDADILIHDAFFTLEGRRQFPTWGHSSWLEAARAAEAAQVRYLGLYHYSPDATDEHLEEEILPQARAIFPNTFLTQEGMTIRMPFIHLEEAIEEGLPNN
ncbi:MAG: MBL fold metallo-hydrolase [Anaerolineae bacterium]|nr:MBL fold metallo-hydrolase [Anaerolineae bacterium]